MYITRSMMFITAIAALSSLANAVPHRLSSRTTTGQRYTPSSNLTYITLEEHVLPAEFKSYADNDAINALITNGVYGPPLDQKLMDENDFRLPNMDANGVRIQVVNNIFVDWYNATSCRLSNDILHRRYVQPHPDRFRGFCALCMGDPKAASAELERCVAELGFVGGFTYAFLIDGPNVTYYDSNLYWPVFATAERLDVPVYLHPNFPPAAQVLQEGGEYAAGINTNGSKSYNDYVASILGTVAWQYETGAGIAFLRLYAAGLFDAFPNIKLVLGHMGEMVPYILERSERVLGFLVTSNRTLSQVWQDNVWVTTSGMFWLQQVPTLLATTPVEHIMVSTDWPYADNALMKGFMEKLRNSSLVTEDQWEGIAYRNAETLLGLHP